MTNNATSSGTERAAIEEEAAPLLGTSSAVPNSRYDGHEAATDNTKPNDKPLPRTQIFLLCFARIVEPIAFFSIFPFINKMVQENGHLDEADVGFYSGLIESLFSFTQMLVMIFWGKASDRLGRKPILVFSLAGVAGATAMFGFAKTIWQMVLFRCIAGVFAGTIVTIRTMIQEHSTPKTQARAFSLFAFSGNLGMFLGPLIGGALADPARQYVHGPFHHSFFEQYPYALPTIATGTIGLAASIISSLFITETLDRKTLERTPSQEPLPSTLSLLKSPGVGMVLFLYGHVMLLAFAYTAVVPVFWFTSPSRGGFGFSPLLISIFMGVTGLSQAIWLLLVFPPLQHRYGTGGVMRGCGLSYPFLFLGLPPLNYLLRSDSSAAHTTFWILAPIVLVLGVGVSMSFTAVQLALNDVSPSPATLGTLNALALTLVSGIRAFSPALFTSIFAIGVRERILGGHLVWVVMVMLAAGFGVATRFLPENAEGKIKTDEGDV